MSLRISTPKSEFPIQDVASLGCGATIFILCITVSPYLDCFNHFPFDDILLQHSFNLFLVSSFLCLLPLETRIYGLSFFGDLWFLFMVMVAILILDFEVPIFGCCLICTGRFGSILPFVCFMIKVWFPYQMSSSMVVHDMWHFVSIC